MSSKMTTCPNKEPAASNARQSSCATSRKTEKEYTPLNRTRKTIRVAELACGRWNDAIECSLHEIPAGDKITSQEPISRCTEYQFEAISYEWGNPDNYKYIVVKGSPSESNVICLTSFGSCEPRRAKYGIPLDRKECKSPAFQVCR